MSHLLIEHRNPRAFHAAVMDHLIRSEAECCAQIGSRAGFIPPIERQYEKRRDESRPTPYQVDPIGLVAIQTMKNSMIVTARIVRRDARSTYASRPIDCGSPYIRVGRSGAGGDGRMGWADTQWHPREFRLYAATVPRQRLRIQPRCPSLPAPARLGSQVLFSLHRPGKSHKQQHLPKDWVLPGLRLRAMAIR